MKENKKDDIERMSEERRNTKGKMERRRRKMTKIKSGREGDEKKKMI